MAAGRISKSSRETTIISVQEAKGGIFEHFFEIDVSRMLITLITDVLMRRRVVNELIT